ncbi:unnamed protein product [Sphenostylis stenocarpa]|uniref:Uncharacterized protein n=1 Tax=Sphenostylis stenocarpa TaxID=92480 RepID=A0AA86SC96_9FABA|nr:unnamed protein product [Sphenostylis stenocarpa]
MSAVSKRPYGCSTRGHSCEIIIGVFARALGSYGHSRRSHNGEANVEEETYFSSKCSDCCATDSEKTSVELPEKEAWK